VAASPPAAGAPAAAVVAASPGRPPAADGAVPPGTVGARNRVALVIGNGGYRHTRALPNPGNDARDVAGLLRRIGFHVIEGVDLERTAMEDLMIGFAKAAAKAELAVAFYAGHGIQVSGTNYLLPVDARVEDEVDLRRLIRLDDMLRDASRAGRLAVVIVDACRDNPFETDIAQALGPQRSTAVGRGLGAPTVPPRTLVAYATSASRTAEDGSGRNSPFTAALLRHLAEPDEIRFVFGKVADAVWDASQGRQRPEIWASLGGDRLYLVRPEALAEGLDAQLTPGERRAVQRSLRRLGLFDGPEDGRFGPGLRTAVREFQARAGAVATGYLTAQQMAELHADARYREPPRPLPPFEIIDLLRRSETEPAAQRLRGALHDPAFAPGPLPKDGAEAARWYRRAAEAGDVEAALALGRILKEGQGTSPDPAEAARWLGLAADAGRGEAQYALAELHRDGRGVPRDLAEAARLFRLAAAGDRGEAIAQLRLLDAW
jgi:hypothetical protein